MIVLQQDRVRVDILNNEVYTHTFQGKNVGNTDVQKLSSTVGCSCTKLICPDVIKPEEDFEIHFIIDKVNQTGLFSVGAIIEFNNNQKLKVNVSGNLIATDGTKN